MTVSRADVALLERLFAEAGYTRLSVAASARALVVSSADETGSQRERFRLVAMPKQRYRVELSSEGRWKDARITGLLDAVVAQLLKSGVAGPPPVSASSARLAALKAHRQAAASAPPGKKRPPPAKP